MPREVLRYQIRSTRLGTRDVIFSGVQARRVKVLARANQVSFAVVHTASFFEKIFDSMSW